MSDKIMQELVTRFLSWHLPESVCADACASTPAKDCFEGGRHRNGTSLLNADEARQMLEYVLADHLAALDAQPRVDVHALANFIRATDGDHNMGAGVLAEAIAGWLDAQPREAEEWRLVPCVPTREMLSACADYWPVGGRITGPMVMAYRAMLAAAPRPPAEKV